MISEVFNKGEDSEDGGLAEEWKEMLQAEKNAVTKVLSSMNPLAPTHHRPHQLPRHPAPSRLSTANPFLASQTTTLSWSVVGMG